MPEKWNMPDTTPEDKQPADTPQRPAENMADRLRKKHSDFFAAVRARGVLNHMLDGPARRFEERNPGQRARWEFCPAGNVYNKETNTMMGDTTFIVAREGLGFHVVDAKELGQEEDSAQKSGPIKVGDLILMAGPEELVQALEEQDAQAAFEDYKLPIQGYRDYIRGIKAKLADGTVKETEPVGDVKISHEVMTAPRGIGMQHELASE